MYYQTSNQCTPEQGTGLNHKPLQTPYHVKVFTTNPDLGALSLASSPTTGKSQNLLKKRKAMPCTAFFTKESNGFLQRIPPNLGTWSSHDHLLWIHRSSGEPHHEVRFSAPTTATVSSHRGCGFTRAHSAGNAEMGSEALQVATPRRFRNSFGNELEIDTLAS